MSEQLLAPLPYAGWQPTKDTVHLWMQIVGKLALRYSPKRNHWWHMTFVPTPYGFTTHIMRKGDTFFHFDFDFLNHRLVLSSNRTHADLCIPLRDGLSVADFYAGVFRLLREIGVDATIYAKPYGLPTITTPFAEDREHASYDTEMVQRWWKIVLWTSNVLERFSSAFVGKASTPQLFWHSLDLAIGRFSGKANPAPPSANPVEAEAYSHEVIAFGFWAGDVNIPAPSYYTYTAAPEPPMLTTYALRPTQAQWVPSGSGHLGILPYDVVRESENPQATLSDFLTSGYEAGAAAARWDTTRLTAR